HKIACPEEIAYSAGFIDADRLNEIARSLGNSSYADYLRSLARAD
ncbi:MAG: glucose-1-phosphate thymidylyltransferase, partial [Hyphomicrobiales bacterium]|nr:glucose-1-phosphate thymidylyltransferase [Hyphomicrobiales bacterium]